MFSAPIIALAIALFLEVVATAIYWWGQIFDQKMKVHPVTWGGFTAVVSLGAWSSISGGGGSGAWVVAAIAAGTWLIFLTSVAVKFVKPQKYWAPRRIDWWLGGLGAISLIARVAGLSPLPTAILAVIGDVCFVWPTLTDVWDDRDSQGWYGKWSWTLTTVAAGLGLLTLESHSFTALLYPFYVFVGTGVLAGACWGWTPGKRSYDRFLQWRKAHFTTRVRRA